MDKQLPYDLDAEESVLGSLLIDGDAINLIDLATSDFFSEQNQVVYQAMLNVTKQVDQLTVAHELNNTGKLDEIGGVSYLSHLVSVVPTSLHIQYYASIVKKCSFNRRLVSMASQVKAVGYKNMDELQAVDSVSLLMKNLLANVGDDSILTPEKLTVDAFEFYTAEGKQQALPTGIPSFDRVKGGFLMGEYVMIAGRTGKGKTTLALQIASNMSVTKKVLFFSMEMFQQQVINKNIARMTGIPEHVIQMKGRYSEFINGNYVKHEGFTDRQWQSIQESLEVHSKLGLYIAEGNRSLNSIRMAVEKQINSIGCDAVFIDYLSLIKDRQGKDGHDRINYLSEELSRMPKEYRIPFCVLHQFNRDIEYRGAENRRPQITDLREGGEESVDLLLMLVRCEDNEFQSELYDLKDRLRGDPCVITVNWRDGTYS